MFYVVWCEYIKASDVAPITDNKKPNPQDIVQYAFSIFNKDPHNPMFNDFMPKHTASIELQTEKDRENYYSIERHLVEFAENAVNKKNEIGEEIYRTHLVETVNNIQNILTRRPQEISYKKGHHATRPRKLDNIENQKSFIASVESFYLRIKESVNDYLPAKGHDEEIAAIISDAEDILNDFEMIVQETKQGRLLDVSGDFAFFCLAADLITQDILIAANRFTARTAAEKDAATKSAAKAAKAKHSELAELKEEAQTICRAEWRNGSNRHHNKIVIDLIEQERFSVPGNKHKYKAILMRTLAKVADEPEFKSRNLKYGAINKK